MTLDVIMYHYVRNNEEKEYDTYCRRLNEFEAQIDFFEKNALIIDPNDLEKIKYYLFNNQRSYLLTFDDGYKDHLYCSQYLASRNLKAYFFTPINAINGELLSVNAIHMLIGKRGLSIKKILEKIKDICLSEKFFLILREKKVSIQNYFENFSSNHKYDRRENQMLKHILQKDLINEKNRIYILDILIKEFLGKDPKKVAKELYLNLDNLTIMKKMGMSFGSHGNTHRWLNKLSQVEQKLEIKESFKNLKKLNLISNNDPQALCYPYGGFNNDTIKLMREFKIDIGFTTKIPTLKFTNEKDYILQLPRWNTNNCWDNEWRRPCNPY